MTRPQAKIVMEVGRWRLLHDRNGWTVKDNNGHTRWPSSLAAALKLMYENMITDNRFADDTQNGLKALRDAIVKANQSFEGLLTPEKVDEINEILREGGR